MNTKLIPSLVILILLSNMISNTASGQQILVPNWIKNNAGWWSEDKIRDSEFIKGIQYLLQKGIMKIPNQSTMHYTSKIPHWIKNNAGWWANGTISDDDFISGIEYLVSNGIININLQNDTSNNMEISECNILQTPSDKETCIQNIEYKTKLKSDIVSSSPYVIGPVTFYHVKSQIEYTEDGKSILTVHFIVNDTGNSEVTLTCPNQNSCNYALSDGQKEIPYTANTLVYGSLTILPDSPKYMDWTFYEGLDYQTMKNYSFIIKEPWGTGSIPIKITKPQ